MAKINLKWRVEPEPTGRYASFQTRAFPSAEYPGERPAAYIKCKESYVPSTHKNATDLELELCVAQYYMGETGHETFRWRRLVKRASSIKEAKEILAEFVNGPQRNYVVPKELRLEKK